MTPLSFLCFLPLLHASPPDFSGTSAFERLNDLVTVGARHYEAPTRLQQIQKMEQTLVRYGWGIQRQSFPVLETGSQKEYTLHNIIALDPHPHKRRVIIGTHWDTRLWAEEDPNPLLRNKPIPGANDGSSGVALLFELAATLQKTPLKHTAVDIIFFDGEEFGRPRRGGYCKGSEYFVTHIQDVYPYTPTGVVILDMIADADLQLEQESHSMSTSPTLWKRLKTHLLAQKIPFSTRSRSIRDDQHPFTTIGIPAVLLIDLSYPYWHTHADTIDKCSAQSMKKVGAALLSWLFTHDISTSD
jgi:glutaminyl-peptide cyclotransferase